MLNTLNTKIQKNGATRTNKSPFIAYMAPKKLNEPNRDLPKKFMMGYLEFPYKNYCKTSLKIFSSPFQS